MAQKKYYAVRVGRRPGIYRQWFGPDGAEIQISGYPGARYRGFATLREAEKFLVETDCGPTETPAKSTQNAAKTVSDENHAAPSSLQHVTIYTDGGCLKNPGPGGFGAVLMTVDGQLTEISEGYRLTTNNRMELLACIVGLEQYPSPSAVVLYSDSRYVVDGITKGWARKWRANNWRKSNGQPALNTDLWQRLLELCERHDVQFVWVRGHAGNPGNERCDRLATQAAAGGGLLTDSGYAPGSG